ncbi:MAG: glycosyl hydrolase family 8 [Vagococcus sp.]|uniref:glycosyl hydrolase family 8 n=1 Tax=Vagococcus sp. TaxID=1933889 RepID=UPI002FC86325
MKKKPLVIWSILTGVILIYVVMVLVSIQSNNDKLQKEIFQDWYDSYVQKNSQGAFVNTSNDGSRPIALSESQGYGMLTMVMAAKKGYIEEKEFIPFVTYYENHQLSEDNYLMNWKQESIKGKWQNYDKNSATDGDLDVAYALIQASEIWPTSTINYEEKAVHLLKSIKDYTYNEKTKVLTVGNWATLSKEYWNLFRPSDVVPTHFDKFYNVTKDNFWQEVKENSLTYLTQLSSQNEFGLIPDFAWIESNDIVPAASKDVATKDDGNYGYNSLRLPFRLAHSKDEKAKKVNEKLLTFLADQEQVKAGYTLSGKALADYPSISYSAPILLATSEEKKFSGLYADARWIMHEKVLGKDYYGDTLKVLSVLQLEL